MKSRAHRPKPLGLSLPLLVEIGCEEIPARFLVQAQLELGFALEFALSQHRLASFIDLTPGSARRKTSPSPTYSTPRRLVVHVPGILERQPDVTEEVTGPPVKVAFDEAGKPTRAAESFALKNGTNLADLIRVTTPKGEYLAVKKTTPGRSAMELLSEILPSVITGLAFPKSMYWVAKAGPRFARPIRWILALLGEGKQARVVPFEIAGVKAGDTTYGHRSLGQRAIRIQGFNDYAKKLRESQVEFDPAQRREVLREQLKVLLEESDLKIIQDPRLELEDCIVNSTEWPRALLGSFEERFLKLPREILITVMRDHQKYFAVGRGLHLGGENDLAARFVAVLNVPGDPDGIIRRGHERVLAARFADAEFFWNSDQKVALWQRFEQGWLEKVIYQAKLGTYADKVRRMEKIGGALCEDLAAATPRKPHETGLVLRSVVDTTRLTEEQSAQVLRAVRLCKCDLTTQMVREFPELQGVVGGLYAREQGEPEAVAQAISEHYLPTGAGTNTPRANVAKLVALADKIDSVVGGFAAVNEPTGSSDPFGLRRQAYGIVAILCDDDLGRPLSMEKGIDAAIKGLKTQGQDTDRDVKGAVHKFLEERLGYYLVAARRLRSDTVRAVLATGWQWTPAEAMDRAAAFDLVRRDQSGVFDALSQAAKRIKNILAKSATSEDWNPGEIQEALLMHEAEVELYKAYEEAANRVSSFRLGHDYQRALEAIASLRLTVDRFFDKVLVMDEDRAVRQNRLRLLGKLDELFSSIADLSQIESTTLDVVDASTSREEKLSDLSRQPSAKASGRRSG